MAAAQGCLRQLLHQGSRRLDHLGRGAQPIALGPKQILHQFLFPKKIAAKNRITILTTLILKQRTHGKNRARSSQVFILSPSGQPLALKPGSTWISGPTFQSMSRLRSQRFAMIEVEVSGAVAVPGLAIMPWPGCCSISGRKERRLIGPSSIDDPPGPLGAAGGGSASRVWESARPIRPLAAAETVPGRGPITQCRLLLAAKPT